MSRVKSDPVTATDAELIRDVRAGDRDAYGLLYERHAPAAQRFARRLAGNPHAADDALADAFTKILAAINNGSGPTTSFRPYLFTAVRSTVIRGTRWRKRVDLTDPAGWDLPGDEPTSDPADRALILEAFATLPERSRAVLWHLEAEGLTPAEVAPILGLSANGVSALAYRSREALRQAYLHAHLAQPLPGPCRSVADLLPAKVRDDLTTRQRRIVDDHLHDCARCRDAVTELDDVAAAFRTVAGPLIGAGGLWSLLRRTSHVSLPVSPRRVAAVAAIAALSVGSGQLLLHRSPIERADALPMGTGATPSGAGGAADVGGGVPISLRVPLANRQAASSPSGARSSAGATAKAPSKPSRSAAGSANGAAVDAAADGSGASSASAPTGMPTSGGTPGGGVGVDAAVPGVVGAGVDLTVGLDPGAVRADASVDANVANAVEAEVDVAADVDLTAPSLEATTQADLDLLDLVEAGVDVGAGLDLRDGSADLGTAIAAGVPRVATLATDLGVDADLSRGAVDADTAVAADLLDVVETDARLAAGVDLTAPLLDATAQADLALVDAVRAGVDVDAAVDLPDGTVSASTAATADLAVAPPVAVAATVDATPTTATATVTVDAPVAMEADVSAATDPATGTTTIAAADRLDLGGTVDVQAGIGIDPSAAQPVDLDLAIGPAVETVPTPGAAPAPESIVEPAPAPAPATEPAPAPVTTVAVEPVTTSVTAMASSVTGLLRAP